MEDRSDEINQMNLPFLEQMEIKNSVRILRLKGAMDHDTLPQILSIREKLTAGHDANSLNILFDMAKVTEIDSSAVAALTVRLDELQDHNHRLGLINLPEKLGNLLDLFKESAHFEIFESEEDALAQLNK